MGEAVSQSGEVGQDDPKTTSPARQHEAQALEHLFSAAPFHETAMQGWVQTMPAYRLGPSPSNEPSHPSDARFPLNPSSTPSAAKPSLEDNDTDMDVSSVPPTSSWPPSTTLSSESTPQLPCGHFSSCNLPTDFCSSSDTCCDLSLYDVGILATDSQCAPSSDSSDCNICAISQHQPSSFEGGALPMGPPCQSQHCEGSSSTHAIVSSDNTIPPTGSGCVGLCETDSAHLFAEPCSTTTVSSASGCVAICDGVVDNTTCTAAACGIDLSQVCIDNSCPASNSTEGHHVDCNYPPSQVGGMQQAVALCKDMTQQQFDDFVAYCCFQQGCKLDGNVQHCQDVAHLHAACNYPIPHQHQPERFDPSIPAQTSNTGAMHMSASLGANTVPIANHPGAPTNTTWQPQGMASSCGFGLGEHEAILSQLYQACQAPACREHAQVSPSASCSRLHSSNLKQNCEIAPQHKPCCDKSNRRRRKSDDSSVKSDPLETAEQKDWIQKRRRVHSSSSSSIETSSVQTVSSQTSDKTVTDERPKGPLPCRWQECKKEFESASALQNHIVEDHVGSRKSLYECKWIGCKHKTRCFDQKQKIKRHVQTHTGDKPFWCEECNQYFSELNTLRQHKRSHTSDKPYKCDYEGCGMRFPVASSLTIHKRTHTGEKPFKCEFCDRRFPESSNLQKHRRTHTGEKPYKCSFPLCGKDFIRPDQLSRHEKTHLNAAMRRYDANINVIEATASASESKGRGRRKKPFSRAGPSQERTAIAQDSADFSPQQLVTAGEF